MPLLYFDCETYSECDLKVHGTHRYAEHPSTEITVAQWAIDDEHPMVLDCTNARPVADFDKITDLLQRPDVTVVAHNSVFDRTLLRHCWGIDVPVERWYDTMIQAMAHGLPGGLDKIGQIVGLDADQAKDKRGRELIQLFCKPRPKNSALRRATRETHPEQWQEFLEYSRQDIVAMRAISQRLPTWNYRAGHPELGLWHLDQRINDRGVAVDVDLATAAIDAVAREQKRLKREVVEQTDGLVTNASQRDNLLAFICAEYGVDLPDMKADTVRRRLEDPNLPEGVKLLLSIRLEATKTSTAKYKALVNATSADGRLRNTLQFAGAQRTARWAGRIFQPQNMPRPDMEQDQIDEGIEALKAGCADLFFDNTMRLTANTVRGCIVAPPGKKLVIADLSNIEGRGLAFLAGERWKLKAFADFDASLIVDDAGQPILDKKGERQFSKPDLYKVAYAKAFNLEADQVTKDQRQQGKVMELGCLAGDTTVVTNNGIKPIMAVLANDLLWDGTSWVQHQGVVAKGVKPVVNVAGMHLTPDHLVLTGTTWTQAKELASNENTLSLALATASGNSRSSESSVQSMEPAISTSSVSNALVGLIRTLSLITTFAKGQARGAPHALENKQATGANTSGLTPRFAQMTSTVAGFSTEYPQRKRAATAQQQNSTKLTAVVVFTYILLGVLTAARFLRTLLRLPDGMTRATTWIASISTKGTNRETFGSSQPGKTEAATSVPSEICNGRSTNCVPTFDILNAGPLSRFTVLTERGPLIVHNCGYEGGVAAFLTFAAVYQMDLEELASAVYKTASGAAMENALGMWKWATKQKRTLGLPENVYVACEILKRAWRDAHPATCALWKAAGDSVRAAIKNPGETFPIGQHLKARRDGAWLRIRLPSGRYLCYINPKVDDDGQITYFGVNQYTRQWGQIKTYSGKLAENFSQAFARDILAYNMPAIERAGYEIVLSVHDELLTETPDTPEFNTEALSQMMATAPSWAQGIPLAAAGFETYRYKKG